MRVLILLICLLVVVMLWGCGWRGLRWFFKVTLPDAVERMVYRYLHPHGRFLLQCENCGTVFEGRPRNIPTTAHIPFMWTLMRHLRSCPWCDDTIRQLLKGLNNND